MSGTMVSRTTACNVIEFRLKAGPIIFGSVSVICLVSGALAEAPSTTAEEAPGHVVPLRLDDVDQYQAVSEGNKLLLDGDPRSALQYYEYAEELEPGAREIEFGKGLSHFHLGEYEDARAAFQRAAAGRRDALADDATYSVGTAYHAEALANTEDPQASLSNLENAMQRYQSVLAHNPNHTAARDANFRAATAWRRLKTRMEQQEQQQQPSENSDDSQENQREQQDQQNQEQNSNQEQQDQQQQSDENQDQQQDAESQDAQPEDENRQQPQNEQRQDQENPSDDSEQQEKDEEKPSDEEQRAQTREERVSREQAERQLREMMQNMRERKKRRPRPTRLVPVRPVDKDW